MMEDFSSDGSKKGREGGEWIESDILRTSVKEWQQQEEQERASNPLMDKTIKESKEYLRVQTKVYIINWEENESKKALFGWVNGQLSKRNLILNDFSDLTDGILLINLCEILSGKSIGRYEKVPRLEFQKGSNINLALDKFKEEGVKVA